jgi:hypothetical protein
LTQSGGVLRIVKGILPSATSILLLLGLMAQCTSNAGLQQQVAEIRARPVVVQVGADQKVFMAKELSEEEKRVSFIREFIPSAFAWTKRTSEDFQEKCKARAKAKNDKVLFNTCATGIDQGVNVKGMGLFTTQIYAYQLGIAPESRKEIMAFIYSQKPGGYEQGESRVLSVDGVGKGEPVPGTPETKTPALMTWSEFDAKNVLVRRKSFDSWVYTRPTLPIMPSATQNPIGEMLSSTLARGQYVTRILPYDK